MPVYCPSCGEPSHHGSVVPGQAMVCPHCTSRIAAPSSAETLPPADEATPRPPDSQAGLARAEGVPFGRYRLVQEIGRGGMGVVWKAWDMQLGRVVALKQILVAGGMPVGRGERFLREARIAARLQHPGIVSVLDVGEHDGRPYYTAEFIDGDRLEERIRPRVEIRQAVVWAKAIAEALYYAHAQGIIHRDVKPGNVLIDRDGRTHVMDFGLAKEVRPEGTPGARLTAEGVLMGTPQYMSPEQVGGKADRIGPASDQFALGVSLYEMIAGRLPFEGDGQGQLAGSQLDLLNAICDREPARLADVDADVRTIVMKALEKDPAARYPTLADMAADLGRWLDGEPITARRISGVRRVVRRAMRHRATLFPAIGVAIAALGVGAWAWVDSRRHAEDADTARAQRDAATQSLKKAGLVQEVLARWARLADAIEALDAAAHDTTKLAEERRQAAEAVWPRIEEFMRATPTDTEAQATMRALAGWARRLAGHEAEGLAWMRDARRIDPDLPYGAVVEALVWFTVWEEGLPLPSAVIATAGIEFGPAPEEPADLVAARERAERLLIEASSAPVWGEGLAREFHSALEAMKAMLGGRYDEADDALTTLLAAASTQAFETDVLLARGKVRYLRKRFEDALADVDRVRQARPGAADVRYVLGTIRSALAMRRARAGGDPREMWREAVREFDAGLAMAPDTPEVRYQRGIAWRSLGEAEAARGGDPSEAYRKAIEDICRAIQADPEDMEAANALGGCRIGVAMALLARGNDPREDLLAAIAEFDRILARDAEHVSALNNRGIARMRIAEVERIGGLDPRGNCEKGVEDLTRALRLSPGSVPALVNRGMLQRMWGDADEDRGQDGSGRFASSLSDFDEAVRIDPESAPTYAARGSTWMSRAEREAATGTDPTASFDHAIADFGEALSRNPADAATRNNRGNLLRARGDAEAARGDDPRATYGKAIADFDAAIEANPRSAKAYYNRGVTRLQMAAAQAKRGIDPTVSYERAIGDLGEALAINPGLTQVYVARGNALRGMAELEAASGKDPLATYDRAIADFGEAAKRNPSSAEAYDGRAVAQAHRGDAEKERGEDPTSTWEKALEDYRRASGVNPRLWGSHANRGMLLERMGRFAEAVESYEAARAIVGDNVPELAGWIERARERAGPLR